MTDWFGDPAELSRHDRDPAAAWFPDTRTPRRDYAAWPGRPLDAPRATDDFHPGDGDQLVIAGHDDRPAYPTHDWAQPRPTPLPTPGQYDRPAHRAYRRTPTPVADVRPTPPSPAVSAPTPPVGPVVTAGRRTLITTAGSYAATLVAFGVTALLAAGSSAPGTARGGILGRLVWFAIAVLASLALGTPLRRYAAGWRPVTIGVAAAILGGGLVTAVASAVGGH